MISNLRISVAVLVVTLLLAAAGLAVLTWLALAGLERLADWWRDRPPGRVREWWYGIRWWWCMSWPFRRAETEDLEELPPPLPPERTWEQMTSHQLPLTAGPGLPPPGLSAHTPQRGPSSRAYLADPGPGYLSEGRERRPPEWETDHRAHYAAMGLEYPSGLMARVRELAP